MMKSSRSVVENIDNDFTTESEEKGQHYNRVTGPQIGSNPTFKPVGKSFVGRIQGTQIGSDPKYGNIGSNPKGSF